MFGEKEVSSESGCRHAERELEGNEPRGVQSVEIKHKLGEDISTVHNWLRIDVQDV